MKRTLVFLAVLALLVGCGATMPSTVEIPVGVPCVVQLPPAPAWATDKLTPTSTRFDRVRALLVEREQARGYILQLEAAAGSCG